MLSRNAKAIVSLHLLYFILHTDNNLSSCTFPCRSPCPKLFPQGGREVIWSHSRWTYWPAWFWFWGRKLFSKEKEKSEHIDSFNLIVHLLLTYSGICSGSVVIPTTPTLWRVIPKAALSGIKKLLVLLDTPQWSVCIRVHKVSSCHAHTWTHHTKDFLDWHSRNYGSDVQCIGALHHAHQKMVILKRLEYCTLPRLICFSIRLSFSPLVYDVPVGAIVSALFCLKTFACHRQCWMLMFHFNYLLLWNYSLPVIILSVSQHKKEKKHKKSKKKKKHKRKHSHNSLEEENPPHKERHKHRYSGSDSESPVRNRKKQHNDNTSDSDSPVYRKKHKRKGSHNSVDKKSRSHKKKRRHSVSSSDEESPIHHVHQKHRRHKSHDSDSSPTHKRVSTLWRMFNYILITI